MLYVANTNGCLQLKESWVMVSRSDTLCTYILYRGRRSLLIFSVSPSKKLLTIQRWLLSRLKFICKCNFHIYILKVSKFQFDEEFMQYRFCLFIEAHSMRTNRSLQFCFAGKRIRNITKEVSFTSLHLSSSLFLSSQGRF